MLARVSGEAARARISLLAISALSFFIIAAMPSDPVMIAIRAWNLPATEETIAAMRAAWGLDLPVPVRYFRWLADFATGDWGRSFRTGEPILAEFAWRLPISLTLGVSGLALAIALAIPLGFAAALRPNGLADRVSRILSIGVGRSELLAWSGPAVGTRRRVQADPAIHRRCIELSSADPSDRASFAGHPFTRLSA